MLTEAAGSPRPACRVPSLVGPIRPTLLAEIVALVIVLMIAFLIRAQGLTEIPRYTDEVNETMSAIDIARGRIWPLVSPTKHVGAYFNYLLAGVILIVGKSPDLPRTVVLLTGVATVAVTYGYARRLGGPVAGLVAATLVGASAPHILLSSRVAWSASLTPLLMVGAAWALDVAVSSRRARLVLLAGLLTGLAFQAHPSVLALLPGLALVILLRGRWLLRRRELYLAGLLFLLACANILIYSTQSGFRTVRSVNQEYPGQVFGPTTYVEHLPAAARGVALAIASAVDLERDPSLTSPPIVLAVAVAVIALVYLGWRASIVPLLIVASALACLPLLHSSFDPLLKARYTMPVVPLSYVAVGVLIADLLRRATRPGLASVQALCGLALWATLLGGFLMAFWRYEAASFERSCTNAPQRSMVAEMQRLREPGEWVLLDEGLVGPAERLGYLQLLEWTGQKVGDASLLRGRIRAELAERPSFLTVISDGRERMAFERQGIPVVSMSSGSTTGSTTGSATISQAPAGGSSLYRVTARGASMLAWQPSASCDQERPDDA